jgi:hypothetical protein
MNAPSELHICPVLHGLPVLNAVFASLQQLLTVTA